MKIEIIIESGKLYIKEAMKEEKEDENQTNDEHDENMYSCYEYIKVF